MNFGTQTELGLAFYRIERNYELQRQWETPEVNVTTQHQLLLSIGVSSGITYILTVNTREVITYQAFTSPTQSNSSEESLLGFLSELTLSTRRSLFEAEPQ